MLFKVFNVFNDSFITLKVSGLNVIKMTFKKKTIKRKKDPTAHKKSIQRKTSSGLMSHTINCHFAECFNHKHEITAGVFNVFCISQPSMEALDPLMTEKQMLTDPHWLKKQIEINNTNV